MKKLNKIFRTLLSILLLTSCSRNHIFDWANIDYKIEDKLEDGNGKKINVILLSGQSNSSGATRVEYLKNNCSDKQFSVYEKGFPNVKINYFVDDGTNQSNGFVNVGLDMGCREGFFGPEVGIAEKVSEELPNEELLIIKYSYSGTCLQTKWLEGTNKKGELYYALVKFVNESMDYLVSKKYDPVIQGMVWMQGEADAYGDTASTYGKALKYFVKSIRNEFKNYIDKEGMAFIDGGISDSSLWEEYEEVNKQKREFANENENNIYVDTIKAGLTYNFEPYESPDIAHYDSLSMIQLGHLFGEEIIKIL